MHRRLCQRRRTDVGWVANWLDLLFPPPWSFFDLFLDLFWTFFWTFLGRHPFYDSHISSFWRAAIFLKRWNSALKTFNLIFGCYICLIYSAIKFGMFNWFDVISGSKNTSICKNMVFICEILVELLSFLFLARTASLEWYQPKHDCISLENYCPSSKLWSSCSCY